MVSLIYILVLAYLEYREAKLPGGDIVKKGKYFSVLLTLTLLVACAPMDSRTSAQDIEAHHTTQDGGNFDHKALAKKYEGLAKDMQAKVQEQKKIINQKSRSSRFGKRGKNIKSHVAHKIDKYEKAAQENLDKAAYHREMSANINQVIKKNKAEKSLNDNNSSL